MSICPFAVQELAEYSFNRFLGGPMKIVHHTTEGSTAEGAIRHFQRTSHWPHFTVDHMAIYQHIDTSLAGRALANASGGVQTNNDGALQIEVVGFAHIRKHPTTLANVARLCRWLEAEHLVARVWPNGIPKPATPAGKDPGGHNRNSGAWDTQSGHYGHCHVPENSHWDPGYAEDEVEYLMSFVADVDAVKQFKLYTELPGPNFDGVVSTMPDH